MRVSAPVCVWRPEVNTEYIPQLSSTFYYMSAFLTELKLARLVRQTVPRDPSCQPATMGTCLHPWLLLTWVLRIETQVFKLVQKILYQLNQQPALSLSLVFKSILSQSLSLISGKLRPCLQTDNAN